MARQNPLLMQENSPLLAHKTNVKASAFRGGLNGGQGSSVGIRAQHGEQRPGCVVGGPSSLVSLDDLAAATASHLHFTTVVVKWQAFS